MRTSSGEGCHRARFGVPASRASGESGEEKVWLEQSGCATRAQESGGDFVPSRVSWCEFLTFISGNNNCR